ncbi:ATP-binding protein [Kitasatospora sp. NPDC056783]|uniref:ATP-binding protein n=1 Tax=Kitasatospora sp. NPDC056783 TaxID=3345943 RepID=UPI003695040A
MTCISAGFSVRRFAHQAFAFYEAPRSADQPQHTPLRHITMATSRRPRMFVARLDSCVESAPLARYMLRAYLSGLPAGERFAETAELLLCELFANAVRYSGAPDDRRVEIRFARVRSRLRLEVHDAGSGLPVLRTASADDEGGRGLFLVNESAERRGCSPRPGGIGKFVWVLVAPDPTPVLATA